MEYFGRTFSETAAAVTGEPSVDLTGAIGRIIVSVVLAGIGGWLALKGEGATQAMGTSMLGALVGYWLR